MNYGTIDEDGGSNSKENKRLCDMRGCCNLYVFQLLPLAKGLARSYSAYYSTISLLTMERYITQVALRAGVFGKFFFYIIRKQIS